MPFSNNLWPGNTLKAVSASGAPKKIAGRVSRNVCVIAIEIIKTPREAREKTLSKEAEKLTTNKLTKFMWMPGVKPVNIPAKIPNKAAIKNSRNIHKDLTNLFIFIYLLLLQ